MNKYTRPREIEIPREIDYEKYYKTIEKYYSGRDYSHGWDHVTKVCENALLICKYENICCEREIIIIIIASLGHDIWDHKYVSEYLIDEIKKCFDNDMLEMGILASDRELIIRIIDNISFSKEFIMRQNGEEFDLEVPEERLRNIVSDADKLEALGAICIKRMIEYDIHIKKTDNTDNIQAHFNHIKYHFQNKLSRLITDNYIKTQTGIRLAKPLMTQMRDIIEEDKTLAEFINNYIEKMYRKKI